MLNHFLNLEFYYIVDVEALVPTIDLTLNIFRCDIVWIIESSCLNK